MKRLSPSGHVLRNPHGMMNHTPGTAPNGDWIVALRQTVKLKEGDFVMGTGSVMIAAATAGATVATVRAFLKGPSGDVGLQDQPAGCSVANIPQQAIVNFRGVAAESGDHDIEIRVRGDGQAATVTDGRGQITQIQGQVL